MRKLLLLFVVMLLPMVAMADDSGSCGANLTWYYSESTKTLYIEGTGDMYDFSNYYNFARLNTSAINNNSKSLGEVSSYNLLYTPWNDYNSDIETIVIDEGVTSIGIFAFRGCSGISSITIPNSVTSIGKGAFAGCIGLTSIIIPKSVTYIGIGAFQTCTSLSSIIVDNENTVYDSRENCNAIIETSSNTIITGCKTTIFPSSVTAIGSSAFLGCTGINAITIPNSVTSIGNNAFDFTNIKSVTIGSGVLSIGSSAFGSTISDYTSSTSARIPAKVIWLTNTPPSGYTNVRGTVHYVANELYEKLSNKTVYPFLSSIFEVNGVKYVLVSPSERTCDAIDCAYNETAEKINIGKTVTYKGINMTIKNVNPYFCYDNPFIKEVDLSFDSDICDYAFKNCANITTATIQNNGNIGKNAFEGCNSIKKVEIKNAGNIGESAFRGITSEFTAIINNVGNIGTEAFKQCTSLKSLEIGTNVTDINRSAFRSCTNLESAILHNQGAIGGSAFSGCSSMINVTLGEGITSIDQYAFDCCEKLKSINIPDAVLLLGSYAFRGCSSMEFAKIGTGVSSINEYTFADCTSLADIKIGSNIKTIDTYAFLNCSALSKIQIPQSVTYINNYVFNGCKSLKEVIMEERKADDTTLALGSKGSSPIFADCPLNTVYIGRNISYSTGSNAGYSPFYRNTSLNTVTITDKETEISPNEFYGCTNLKNVRIGDGVETIGDWAFSGCSSLDYFAFGSSVKAIGKEAFSDCTAMTRLISRATTPPTCGSQALDDINKWNCTLSVPTGTTAVYQQADQWKEFFFIDNDITGISKLTKGTSAPTHIYDLQGRKVQNPRNGLYIIDGKKVVVK